MKGKEKFSFYESDLLIGWTLANDEQETWLTWQAPEGFAVQHSHVQQFLIIYLSQSNR